MRKFLAIIPLVLLFLSPTTELKAQVDVKIGSFQMCYHSTTSMPVIVQNMVGVDDFRIALAFNHATVDYVDFFAKHSALTGGSFAITSFNDSIIISWFRTAPASILNDTLVWLKFNGLVGSTPLTWTPSGSFFHTLAGNQILNFTNGSATVNPEIRVVLTEIDPTCTSKNDANYLASASGGTGTFTYLWNGKPGRFDSIQTNLYSGFNHITISDSKGCKLDSNFTIIGLPGASVNLIIEGNDDTAIYLQNPVLSFRFEENAPTHVVEPPTWLFGDGDSAVSFNPTHVYSRAITNTDGYYDMELHIKNENGCDTTIKFRIEIEKVDPKIPNIITPNGDSFNETFIIGNTNKTGSGEEIKITSEFQRMELVIFDRWGRKIYDDSNYQSDWKAKGVPDGAYYYILKTVGFYETKTYKGSITVLGSGTKQ